MDYFYEIAVDEEIYNTFLNVIKKLLNHEMVHVIQFAKLRAKVGRYGATSILNKAKWKHNSERGYLIDKMEIQAFASEAVAEFRNIGYTDAAIINKLRNLNNNNIHPSPYESDSFLIYFESFYEYGETREDKKVWRRFVKNMINFIL